jgi:hypothetical protein
MSTLLIRKLKMLNEPDITVFYREGGFYTKFGELSSRDLAEFICKALESNPEYIMEFKKVDLSYKEQFGS